MTKTLKFLSEFLKKIAFDEYKTTISTKIEDIDLSRMAEYDIKKKTITINHMLPKGTTMKDLYFVLLHELAHIPPPEGNISFSHLIRLEKKYEDYINNLKNKLPEQVEVHNVIFFKEYERLKRKYTFKKFLDFYLTKNSRRKEIT